MGHIFIFGTFDSNGLFMNYMKGLGLVQNSLRKKCKLRRCRTGGEEPAGGGQVEERRNCVRALDFYCP